MIEWDEPVDAGDGPRRRIPVPGTEMVESPIDMIRRQLADDAVVVELFRDLVFRHESPEDVRPQIVEAL